MGCIKKLSQEDNDEIYRLSQFAFQYNLTEEELEKKKQEAKLHQIWGWLEDGNLAAKLHIIPLQIFIAGQKFEMGGINAVATWPEYRRRGIVKELLYHALKQQKLNGQTISLLHPFSFKFYRKYGWELAFMNKKYTIPIEKLKVNWNTDGYVKRVSNNIPLLQSIYTEYAKEFNGMLGRDEHWWRYRVLKDDFQCAVSYSNSEMADGYVIYKVENDLISVREIIYHSVQARKTLLQFIANHDSMAEMAELTVPEEDQLSLLLDEPRFKQELNPYFMARIVDVEAFFQQYPFKRPTTEFDALSITVKDDFLETNNVTLSRNETSGRWKYSKRQEEAAIHSSIQQLTVMLLGYKRPLELLRLGLITGSEQAVIQLDEMIPRQQTFLSDFF